MIIRSIGPQFSGGIYTTTPVKKNSDPIQDKNPATARELTIPYHVPLPFKGVNRTVNNLKHNSADIAILEDIEKLSDADKKAFVQEYCKQTGFPNLETVNQKIRTHAKEATQTAAQNVGLNLLWCGYHSSCSVSRGLALPGSDLDARPVIVDGNQEQIERFKGALWNNYNPLLVSIRGDFSDVFNVNQLYEWTKLVDEIVEENGLDKKAGQYKENLKETEDYQKALMFNIDIRKAIEKYDIGELKEKAPSLAQHIEQKSNEKYVVENGLVHKIPTWITQSMSACLETLRSGIALVELDNLTAEQAQKLEQVKGSYLYQYGNICTQDADYDLKPKLAERQVISKEWFEKLPLDEQVDFISKMIYESYPAWAKAKIKAEYGKAFKPMFDSNSLNETRDKAFQECV